MGKPIAMSVDELREWKKTGIWPDERRGEPKLSKSGRYVQPQPKRGEMNKTETSYAVHLSERLLLREITSWKFEAGKLRLAKRCYYEPDFLVWCRSGAIELHEVKGFWRDDARVKIKTAAEMFPMFRFVAVTRSRGGWTYEFFQPGLGPIS